MFGFALEVLDKFINTQGNYLAAVVTYYAFVSIFPLLLIASSVLGFLLQGNPALKNEVLTGALSQFPIVGTELGKPTGLQGSTSAVVFGTITALYGVLGLGQAAQNAVNVVWAVPRNSRFNPVLSRASSLALLVLAGLTVLAVTVLTSIVSHVDVFGPNVDRGLGWLLTLSSIVLNALVLAAMMRLATTARQSFRSTLPGAIAVALMCTSSPAIHPTGRRTFTASTPKMYGSPAVPPLPPKASASSKRLRPSPSPTASASAS